MTAAPLSIPSDIVSLRICHCRAEQAALQAHYHLAVQQYLRCLEAAELRQDVQATQFFALRLADCYEQMNLEHKAQAFRGLAELEVRGCELLSGDIEA